MFLQIFPGQPWLHVRATPLRSAGSCLGISTCQGGRALSLKGFVYINIAVVLGNSRRRDRAEEYRRANLSRRLRDRPETEESEVWRKLMGPGYTNERKEFLDMPCAWAKSFVSHVGANC